MRHAFEAKLFDRFEFANFADGRIRAILSAECAKPLGVVGALVVVADMSRTGFGHRGTNSLCIANWNEHDNFVQTAMLDVRADRIPRFFLAKPVAEPVIDATADGIERGVRAVNSDPRLDEANQQRLFPCAALRRVFVSDQSFDVSIFE